MRWLRNQVVAPLTEELVFRACMVPMLVPCAGPSTAIFTCPLFFGVGECKSATEKQQLWSVWWKFCEVSRFSVLLGVCVCLCLTGDGSTFSPRDWAPALQTRDHLRNFSFCRYVKTFNESLPPFQFLEIEISYIWLIMLHGCLLFCCSVPVLIHSSIWSLHCLYISQNRCVETGSFHVWLLELNTTYCIITGLYNSIISKTPK